MFSGLFCFNVSMIMVNDKSREENGNKRWFKNKLLHKANRCLLGQLMWTLICNWKQRTWFRVSKYNCRGWAYFFIDSPKILPGEWWVKELFLIDALEQRWPEFSGIFISTFPQKPAGWVVTVLVSLDWK